MSANRLVILSGPSCVGKSPLARALDRFYPDLAAGLPRLVLFNSRSARPGEVDGVDYHFRRRDEVEALRGNEQYVVLDVRGDLQAREFNLQVQQSGPWPRVGFDSPGTSWDGY